MTLSLQDVLTIPQLLETSSEKNPEREAIYDLSRRLTYRKLKEESDQLAAVLAVRGIQKGDRVGVCLPNWHETVLIFFAVCKIGGIIVPLNPRYRLHEIQHIIQDCKPKLIFISEEFDRHLGIETITPWSDDIVSVRFEKAGITPFHQLLTKGVMNPPLVEIDPINDDFCILYTSGTTGFPKGAILTHQNVTQSAKVVASELKCSLEDVYIINIPLFNVFGLASCLMSAVYMQSKIVLQDKYSPKEALGLIEKEQVTIRHSVPAMFIMELNHREFASYNLSSLRVGLIGGAPVHIETIKNIRNKMKMEICPGYGLTEVCALTQTKYPDQDVNVFGTIGKVLPGIQLKIVNNKRETLPFGEVGEIACKGYGNIKGYYDAPEKTKQSQDDEGWFYTGDLGTLDEEGYLRFSGREKELIIRGGSNIYPQEIEGILYEHPKVLEAAVIGLPDPVMGESVCAVIKLRSGVESFSDEIKEYLVERLANYKVPSEIIFIENLPVTGSGKIEKVQLKKEIINRLHV